MNQLEIIFKRHESFVSVSNLTVGDAMFMVVEVVVMTEMGEKTFTIVIVSEMGTVKIIVTPCIGFQIRMSIEYNLYDQYFN